MINLYEMYIGINEILLAYGPLGLFILAFLEASIFLIPPEAILIPLALFNPDSSFIYALIASIGSTLGGIFGYYLGFIGGKRLLLRLTSEEKIIKIKKYFDKYGGFAIGIAGFTPIPYKVFMIASGVFRTKLSVIIILHLFYQEVLGFCLKFYF